jgi:hypothetical protein
MHFKFICFFALCNPCDERTLITRQNALNQMENEVPHPQALAALGFFILKDAPAKSST